MKTCSKCKRELDFDQFHKNRRAKDGLQTHCKACHIAQVIACQKQNPEAKRAADRRWREQNPEANRAAVKRWREQNPLKEWMTQSLAKARARAKIEDVPFTLTKADLQDVLPEMCPVTGERLAYSSGKLSGCSATIDRLIPVLGYTPANISIISLSANASKQNNFPKGIETRAKMFPNDERLQRLHEWIEHRLEEKAVEIIAQLKKMLLAGSLQQDKPS